MNTPPKILAIDDEPIVLKTLVRILKNYDVTTASESSDALEVIRNTPFDLILCDLMMPVMTGIQLFKTVCSEFPEYQDRFMFLTGGAFTSEGQNFVNSIDNRVIEKPFDIGALRATIKEFLHQ